MRRRELIFLLGGALMAARALRAQQKAMPLIGYLSSFSPPPNLGELGRGPVHQGLGETGYVEGQNMTFENRWAEGMRKIERTPETVLRNGGVGLILQQQEFAFDP